MNDNKKIEGLSEEIGKIKGTKEREEKRKRQEKIERIYSPETEANLVVSALKPILEKPEKFNTVGFAHIAAGLAGVGPLNQ